MADAAETPKPTLVSLEVSRVMAEMGRRGGKIGGKHRAQRMTDEQRSNAATLAARARWAKRKALTRSEPYAWERGTVRDPAC